MDSNEFVERFGIQYNNITSNQAPGLNVHEISVFLTTAEKQIVKNHFNAASKGNTLGQGFDDSAARQADFSSLMDTKEGGVVTDNTIVKSHKNGKLYTIPDGVFIIIHETYRVENNDLQVIPLRYDDYLRLMSKPFKRPVAGQAWRIIGTGNADEKTVEIVAAPEFDSINGDYIVRFIRKPKPIIVGDLDGLEIDGYTFGTPDTEHPNRIDGCELDSSLHEEILQRAVELAKAAWVTTGAENVEAVMAVGQRSE